MNDRANEAFGYLRRGLKRETIRLDGWLNPMTGLGTGRDKQSYSRFLASGQITDQYAETLYCENPTAARVCDAFPEYALKKSFWVKIKPDFKTETGADLKLQLIESLKKTTEQQALFNTELKRLNIVSALTDALVWSNVFGASALLMGAFDGAFGPDLKEPLQDYDDLKHVTVLDKQDFSIASYYTDLNDPRYGTPRTYWITSQDSIQSYELHETRLIVLGGVRTPRRRRQLNQGFDGSLLSRGCDSLSKFGISWDTLNHLIQDANQGVFKMKGYIEALAADEEDLIQKRIQLMDMQRGAVKALVMDSDTEDFRRENFSWGGFRDPFDLLMYKLASDFRVPVSVIMGRSPAGMNATGESDWANLESQVEIQIENEVKPIIVKIAEFIFKAKRGPFGGQLPADWEPVIPPLRTMTPIEQADIRAKDAQTYRTYIEAGVLTPDEVAISQFGPDSDSDISIDITTRIGTDADEDYKPKDNERDSKPATKEPESKTAGETSDFTSG